LCLSLTQLPGIVRAKYYFIEANLHAFLQGDDRELDFNPISQHALDLAISLVPIEIAILSDQVREGRSSDNWRRSHWTDFLDLIYSEIKNGPRAQPAGLARWLKNMPKSLTFWPNDDQEWSIQIGKRAGSQFWKAIQF
jgi:hypothetical protein